MQIRHDTHTAPILGLYAKVHAQAYYRLCVPLGHVDAAVTCYHDATQAQRDAARLVILARMTTLRDLPVRAAGDLVRQIQDGGRRRVWIDQDDALEVDAEAHTQDWGPSERERMTTLIRAADGVICTNTTLANRLKAVNRRVRVIPNYLRLADWPEPVLLPAGPPVILLTGSSSHHADWREVVPALTALRGTGRAFRLRIVGHCPRALAPLADEHIPWGPFLDYPRHLAGAAIALCPLPRTAFNVCKSPIKLFETALSGCAVIGSATQYGPLLRAAGLDHAVITIPAQWQAAIATYLDDPDRRTADAARLRASLVQWDSSRHAATIQAAYAAMQEGL